MTLKPGDTVYLDGSANFIGNLRLDASDAGTASNPVTITSYGSGRATITARDANGTTIKDGDAIHVENASGIHISNLMLVGTGNFNSYDKTPAGINFLTNGAAVRRDFVQIDHVDVTHFWQAGIYLQHVTGLGYSNVTISDSDVHDSGNTGIEFIGGAVDASTGVMVSNCRAFANAGHSGLSHNSGSGIVLSSVKGGTIQDSVAFGNGTIGYGGEGIWAWNAANITIQRNECYDNHTSNGSDGGGFDLDGGVTNSVMQYNFSHDNEGSGYGLFQFSGAASWGNNIVRYNVSRKDAGGNDAAGISLWNGGSGIANADIYGNTIYLDNSNLQSSATPQALVVASKTTNVRFFNNIFMTKNGILLIDAARGQAGIVFQNNDFYAENRICDELGQQELQNASNLANRRRPGGQSVDPAAV